MVYKRKQIFLFSLLSLLLILFLFSNIGRSYLISFVHVVRGDDVVAENLPSESEDKILDIDGEDDLVKEDSEENSEENLPALDDSTSSKETSLNEENVLEDSKEEPVDNGEIKTDDDAISEEVALEEENDQSELPVTSENEENDINTREGGTRVMTPIIAFVNVINNTSSTPVLNATSFSFVHTNDDGSNTINIDEDCSPDYMSCNKKIDFTYSHHSHFFNLEHTEYLDYHTEGFSCLGGMVEPYYPVSLPVMATSLSEPNSCTITYEYVDPKITIFTPTGEGTSGNANIEFIDLFGLDNTYGNGISSNGQWEVTYTPPEVAPTSVKPSSPCYDTEDSFISHCYYFEGECSGENFDFDNQKTCNVTDSGLVANIPVNSFLVKNYPPQNNDDYLDNTDLSLIPTVYENNINEPFAYSGSSMSGNEYTTKIFFRNIINVGGFDGFDLFSTPINITDTHPIGYEYLGCRERPNNTLSNELHFDNANHIHSEIDCFYKVLPIQLTISKNNNSLLDGINVGDVVDYTIEVKAPNDSSAGTYLSNQTMLYDKLPAGITYQPGTFVATSSRRGNLPLSEPAYSGDDWATWDLGDIQEGEVVTLTYKAKISTGTLPGTYTDQSYVKGMSLTDEEVLGVGANGTEFVSSNILVVTATSNPTNNQNTPTEVETSSENIKKLPNTGVTIYLSIFGMFSILIGITLLKINRNNLIN